MFRNGVQVATSTSTSALITGLAANTTYSFTVAAVNGLGTGPQSGGLSVTTTTGSSTPNFGPNVVIFDPSMPVATIQNQINSIFAVQQNNQFGTPRTAMLFKPGNYNVDIPIGFFTQIAGWVRCPDAVNIANVHSDAVLPNFNGTQNFWRAVENFSVTPPGAGMKWAVSQACPFRRMHIRANNLLLHDNNGWVSGGWMSDSLVDFDVGSNSQQQWISRNSQWGSWTGNVWNMVFVGIPANLPGGVWPTAANTFVNPTPISREKPFLWLNGANYEVYVPALRTNTNGITWGAGQTQGTSIPLDQFYVARAGVDNASTMNAALNAGLNLLLTPGIYDVNVPIQVNRPNAIVMGMGYATLRPTAGNAVLTTADVDGVKLAHIFVDAGATNSPVLVQIGPPGSSASHAANPITIHDLFIRIGGATVGRASVSLQINSHNTLLDHTWLWRADHGNGGTFGWDINTAANGLVVNGNNVTAYGLFVEHFQQYQTIWNGNGGRVYFYQSEIPYDPPSNRQDLWTSAPGVNGWASYKVANSVTSHEAWGMGIYSVFFTQGQRLTRAIETPVNPNVRFHHLVTVNLTADGGIDNVINTTGGATRSRNRHQHAASHRLPVALARLHHASLEPTLESTHVQETSALIPCLRVGDWPAGDSTRSRGPNLLSQGRPVVASSAQAPFVAANAVDGNTGTRWGSNFTNNEWIYVDLGSHRHRQPRRAELGSGLRQRLSDPGVRQRDDLDHHLHHHHRQRRHR